MGRAASSQLAGWVWGDGPPWRDRSGTKTRVEIGHFARGQSKLCARTSKIFNPFTTTLL